MENFQITAAQISASSLFDGSNLPTYGRLHFKGGLGAWATSANDGNQWFQIDLRVEANVTFVATQGKYGSGQRVTQYKLKYSKDGFSFQTYKQYKENSDKVRGVSASRSKSSGFVVRPSKRSLAPSKLRSREQLINH